MKKLVLIVSVFFFCSSSYAQDLNKYGFAMMTDSKCENHNEAMKYLKQLVTYVEANAPNSTQVRCGKDLEGRQGCLVLTESYDAYEENQSFWETDEEWNRLIRLAWKECGIEDFSFGRKAITFE